MKTILILSLLLLAGCREDRPNVNAHAVPDGGATIVLLAAGLGALVWARKKA